jgi:recombinational DNA repair protein (RecF pathway)
MPPSQCEGQPYLSVTIFFKETGSLQMIAKSLKKRKGPEKGFSAEINISGIGPNVTFY